MKSLIKNDYILLCGYPWIIDLKSDGRTIQLEGELSLEAIENTYKPKDGDEIFEVRPLIEFTYTREDGKWYREKTGIGYA